jgi:hypothetical protein
MLTKEMLRCLVVDSWTRRAHQVKQFNEQSKGVAHPWVISYRG